MKGKKRLLKVCLLLMISCMAILSAIPAAAAKKHSTVFQGQDYKYVYDYDYYTTNVHPEMKGKSDASVLNEFVKRGMAKGEQAIASFNVKSYYYGNQDLRGKYGKNYKKYYLHYQETGHSVAARVKTATGIKSLKNPVTVYKGIDYSKVYNYNYYKAKHPSAAASYVDDDFGLLKHFVEVGIPRQYKSSKDFDVKSYRYGNKDLRLKFGSNYRYYYLHYCKYGYKNRRSTATGITSLRNIITSYNGVDYSNVYDFKYYTTNNAAAKKYADDDVAAIKHFLTQGLIQNLQAKKGVSPSSAAYQNLRNKRYPELSNKDYQKAYQYSSKTPWLILLDQGNHKVTIFKGDQDKWEKQTSFACTVGKPETATPTGVFTIGSRGQYFTTGYNRCWWYTQIHYSILFHSVIYSGYSSPVYVVDGRLGLNLSHGCVRLALSNAKWIHDNIPRGTTVVSYNRPF